MKSRWRNFYGTPRNSFESAYEEEEDKGNPFASLSGKEHRMSFMLG